MKCSWLQPFRPSNQGGNQEHFSLITNSFFVILHSSSSSYLKGRLKMKDLKMGDQKDETLENAGPENAFLHVCILQKNLLFLTIILG